MNHLLRTCKCHWVGEEYLHWGAAAERRAFAAPGTAPQFPPDATLVGRHMRLELHFDFDQRRVWGSTTHELEVRCATTREAMFNAVGLEVSRVTVNGRRAAFENTGEQVLVTLPRAFRHGAQLTVALEHGVTRPAAGLYFTNPDAAYPERFRTAWSQGQDEDSRYYFPCLDRPNFKQTSEALLYVPRGDFALSNGDLVRHRRRATAGEDLWHYRMELPYSTYLFSVVVGNFAAHKERAGKVEVRWFCQPGREREAANAFGNTGDILRFLADFTGHPYPHRQYTQIAVPDFIFGGMENFTVTTQTDLTLHDDRAHLDFSSDDLVAHEAAHTWFGNLVTARGWAHAWLHESFATYMEALYTRESLGPEEHDYQLLRDAEAYFHEDTIYRRPLVTYRYEAPIDLFDSHLYPGGAVRLRHLHALLGEQAFRASLRRYLADRHLGLAETVDLARAIEAETGLNFDWWFHQWIFSAGYPTFEVKYAWKAEEGLAEVVVRQTQRLADGTADPKRQPFFRVPTRLGFLVGRDLVEVPITVEGESSQFLVRLARKPTLVLFDPRFECPVKRVKFEKPQEMLLHQLRHGPGAVARIEAAAALAEKPNATVTRTLRERLRREPFWGVQQRIARALGRISGAAARDALVVGLRLEHPKARRAVVEALGHFRDDPAAAQALERLARRGDPSYYVEGEVARALGRCRAPGARKLLEEMLRRLSHADVIRTGAYDGLAELNDPASLGLLEEGLRYGAPPVARRAAIRGVGTLAHKHPHLRPRALELLQPVVEHKDDPAATFAAKLAGLRALQQAGDLDAQPLVSRVAAAEVDGRLVRLARDTLRALRAEAARPAEMQALRTDVEQVTRENKTLRDRLEALEQKTAPQKKKPAARARPAGRRRQGRARG